MHTHDQSANKRSPGPSGDRASRFTWWVFGGFAALGLTLLALEHRAHLLGWLPWLILLACPLMHLFMHGGHGGHGADSNRQDDK